MHENGRDMHDPEERARKAAEAADLAAKKKAGRERLGRFLRSERKGLGLTQAQMAKKLGVDQATISRYESGKPFDGNPAAGYGLKEHYPSAPLDPVARRDWMDERNRAIQAR